MQVSTWRNCLVAWFAVAASFSNTATAFRCNRFSGQSRKFAPASISLHGNTLYHGDDFAGYEEEQFDVEPGQKLASDFYGELELRNKLDSLTSAAAVEDGATNVNLRDDTGGSRAATLQFSNKTRLTSAAMIGATALLVKLYWVQALVSAGLLGFYFAMVSVFSHLEAYRREAADRVSSAQQRPLGIFHHQDSGTS